MATFFGIPLPGLSGFRDPTQQQIAQLQGMTPADPYTDSGWQPFSPGAARWNAAGAALTNLGAGLLSGRNWSEGLSRGLMGANQGFQDALQNARRDYYVDQQGRYMQRRMQQEDRASARQDAADQRKAAAIADLSANPPAGVDPQRWAAMVAADPEGMASAAGKSLFEKPDAPKTVGGMMWDGKGFVPIPGFTEQASRIAAAGRAPAAPVQPDRELVVVPDPTSPTGLKYMRRSDAAGLAAPAKQSGGVEYTNVMNDKGQVQAYIKGSPEADAAVKTPGSRVVGATLTGGGANVTEQQRRAQMQYSVVQPEAATLAKTWTALSDSTAQILAKGGNATNFMQSGDYQRARNSIKTIVASWLYVSSGATANPGEVETQTDALMPQFGDDAATIADKQRRVQTYIDSIGQMAAAANQAGQGGQPGATPPAAANNDPLGLR